MALAAFLVTPYNASSGVNPIKVQPMFITSNNDEQGADPEREPRENRERTEREPKDIEGRSVHATKHLHVRRTLLTGIAIRRQRNRHAMFSKQCHRGSGLFLDEIRRGGQQHGHRARVGHRLGKEVVGKNQTTRKNIARKKVAKNKLSGTSCQEQ